MYLFTRTIRLRAGAQRESLAWAGSVTEKVNQITELDVSLWRTIMSPGLGQLVWVAAAQDLTELENADAKLAVDDVLTSLIDSGAKYLSDDQVDDEVAQFLTEVDPNAPQTGTHAAVVRSELAPGGFAKGIEAGLEIARRATELGSVPTAFLLSTTGKYGAVTWVSEADSLKAIEESDQKVNSDPGFVAYVDSVGACFIPGITTQTIYQRII